VKRNVSVTMVLEKATSVSEIIEPTTVARRVRTSCGPDGIKRVVFWKGCCAESLLEIHNEES
jgi:hypothetical protein